MDFLFLLLLTLRTTLEFPSVSGRKGSVFLFLIMVVPGCANLNYQPSSYYIPLTQVSKNSDYQELDK